MIVLTNLQGEQLAINDGLIERVEGDHDTRVTLTSGAHYIVREPVDEIVRLCREDRAAVMALSRRLEFRADPPPAEGVDDDGAELHLLHVGRDAASPARRANDRPAGESAGSDGWTSDDR